MIDPITMYLLEGYLISDKTISVNLSEFESGISKKLLIIGVPGSGKTSLGRYLAKKYNVQQFVSDDHWKKMKDALTNSKKAVIEGAGLANLYSVEESWRKMIINKPMIIMGLSAIKAGLRADVRDGMLPATVKDKKDVFYFMRKNTLYWEKLLGRLRKDIKKIPNAEIKEYKLPPEVQKYLTGRL